MRRLFVVGKMTVQEAKNCARQYISEGRVCGGCKFDRVCGIRKRPQTRREETSRGGERPCEP